jgi:hypothetical protein
MTISVIGAGYGRTGTQSVEVRYVPVGFWTGVSMQPSAPVGGT